MACCVQSVDVGPTRLEQEKGLKLNKNIGMNLLQMSNNVLS